MRIVPAVSANPVMRNSTNSLNCNVEKSKKMDVKAGSGHHDIKYQKFIGYSAGFLMLGSLAFYALTKKTVTPNVLTQDSETVTKSLNELFKEQMQKFPKDIDYRKKILELMGLKDAPVESIRSIVGADEYKSLVKEFESSSVHFSPGDSLISEVKDGFNQKGREAKTYRISLHMHTNNSDGAMSVEELLTKSALYADEVAEAIKSNPTTIAKDAPFTIAITDHDTLEGCKEAVKIIQNNPEKFKNLRVVLGCEFSVDTKAIPQELQKTLDFHLLTHAINPFDSELNCLIDSKKEGKRILSSEIISDYAEKIKAIRPNMSEVFNFNEAKDIYKSVSEGVLYPKNGIRDYLQYRTIFTECFENNNFIQEKLKEKSINSTDINYLSLRYDYFSKNYAGKKSLWKDYHEGLIKYTSNLIGLSLEELRPKMEIKPEIFNFIEKELPAIIEKGVPNLEKNSAFMDLDEVVNLIKKQDYGYMTIAHPGLIDIGNKLKNPAESLAAMNDLFKTFKEKGGDKAFAAEIHYHYYGSLGKSTDWLNYIQKCVKENNLHFSGGLDTHEKSIFYSCK